MGEGNQKAKGTEILSSLLLIPLDYLHSDLPIRDREGEREIQILAKSVLNCSILSPTDSLTKLSRASFQVGLTGSMAEGPLGLSSHC